MNASMNELIQFSPFGGKLVLEEVKGNTSGKLNPENNVDTVIGADRDMWVYVPASGCPHAKQAQVLLVLRDESTFESAEKWMQDLKLDRLAEDQHFILVFPNPTSLGWNTGERTDQDNDIQFLTRCFAALPKSKGGASAFNGMIFLLGTSTSSSAMVATLAIQSPLDAAAIMVTDFPKDYVLPQGKGAAQVAWVCGNNPAFCDYLKKVNEVNEPHHESGISIYKNLHNGSIRFYTSSEGLTPTLVQKAWDWMFSETRRWRNDTFGTYQPRIDFAAKGFVKHYQDDALGINNNFKHTWYEYVPQALRGSTEKVPLVLYFHGINCVGLYGAEQSGLASLADKDKFIVVFPDPAIEERWNVWDDPRLPSDVDFIMALIEHMKTVHPIDESRIYISGFSMGSMFTNALACAYPDVFAAAMAFNGPHVGYLTTLDQSRKGMAMFRPKTVINTLPVWDKPTSPIHDLADQKKAKFDYRIPMIQFVGLLDNVGFTGDHLWPVKDAQDGSWPIGLEYWKNYNNIRQPHVYDSSFASGFASAACIKEGKRFIHQLWTSSDSEPDALLHLISVERMPHAVDLAGFEIGWNLIRQYRRHSDGSLSKK